MDVLCIPIYQHEKCAPNDKEQNVQIKNDYGNKIVCYYSQEILSFLRDRAQNKRGLQNAGLDKMFAKIIKILNTNYDLVYVQDYFVSFIGAFLLLNNIAKKMVSCVHLPLYAGFTYFDKPIDDELHQALEAVLIRFSSRVIVPSFFAKRVLTQIYSINPDKISAIPLGVRIVDTCPRNKHMDEPINCKAKKLKLLSVSRFTEQKGLTYIFDVLSDLKRNNIDFEYVLIGTGPKESEFNQIANKKEFDKEICHIRHIDPDEIFQHYRQSDLYISTSIYETFGLSILEAMSQRCLPIAFNLAAIKELIKDNETGILVDIANRKKMSDAIIRYYKQPQTFAKMQSTAAAYARTFSWDKHVTSILRVFNECFTE